MISSVDFYYNFFFNTDKINNVIPNDMLPIELNS